ncbi:hypothetical protein IF650_02845 [Cellulosimicrobium terreum]|nr:hypothetical protein [Cellulosimicrobium terreum]
MTDSTHPFHSIANPRRTTLMTVTSAEAAAPQRDGGSAFTMVGVDDAGTCVDGVCALPE